MWTVWSFSEKKSNIIQSNKNVTIDADARKQLITLGANSL